MFECSNIIKLFVAAIVVAAAAAASVNLEKFGPDSAAPLLNIFKQKPDGSYDYRQVTISYSCCCNMLNPLVIWVSCATDTKRRTASR